MDDLTLSQTWLNKAIWGAALLGAYVLCRYQHKVDLLEQAQQKFVTREELSKELALLREDAQERHRENSLRLDRIGDGMVRIHERIDKAIEK